MGEIQYVWADPGQPQQQVALSSIVRAMDEKDVVAIARWVSRDGMDPKMGVLAPTVFENVDCLLWAQVYFRPCLAKENAYSCIYSDAFRRRRPQIHICLPRQPRFQKRRANNRPPLSPHHLPTRSDGCISRRYGSHERRRERRRDRCS